MTQDHSAPTIPLTLLEAWVARSRLSWLHFALTVTLILVLFLAAAAYVDRIRIDLGADEWKGSLLMPVVVAYALLLRPWGRRLLEKAVQALRPMLLLDDHELEQLIAVPASRSRQREWLAIGIGIALGCLLFRLLISEDWQSTPVWSLYWLVSLATMGGVVGSFIYPSLLDSRLFIVLQRQPLTFNIFKPDPFEPIARWSLGVSLAFVGGLALAILFAEAEYLFQLEYWIGLLFFLVVAVLIFFFNMRTTHQVMVAAKRRELNRVGERIDAAYQALLVRREDEDLDGADLIQAQVATFLAYEKRIRQVPEWPYTTNMIRNLGLSFLLPLLASLAQQLLVRLLLP